MEVKYVNPFIQSFMNVMPMLGFTTPQKVGLTVKPSNIKSKGVMVIVGIVGTVKGNVIYSMTQETAKSIASTMMCGMPVNELDDMAQSAISELANMLTAQTSMIFSESNISTDISTPTFMCGNDFFVKASLEKVLCVKMAAGNIEMEINVAVE